MPCLVDDRNVKAAIGDSLNYPFHREHFECPANVRASALITLFQIHLFKPRAIAERPYFISTVMASATVSPPLAFRFSTTFGRSRVSYLYRACLFVTARSDTYR